MTKTKAELRTHEVVRELRKMRTKANVSQREMARRLGVSHDAICYLETERGGRAPIDMLIDYAEALGATLEVVINKTPEIDADIPSPNP